jgi:primosomal protein N'
LPLAFKNILPSNLKSFLRFLKEEPIENPVYKNVYKNLVFLNKFKEKTDFDKINFSEINDLKTIKEKIDSLSSNSQVLFLAPTLFHLEYFQEKFSQGIIFQKKDRKSFKIFKEIFEGKPLLILGTRSAVFLPFLNLKLIIVNEPENPSYKSWEQKPFYHSLKIVQKLSLYHQAELIFYSSYDT